MKTVSYVIIILAILSVVSIGAYLDVKARNDRRKSVDATLQELSEKIDGLYISIPSSVSFKFPEPISAAIAGKDIELEN